MSPDIEGARQRSLQWRRRLDRVLHPAHQRRFLAWNISELMAARTPRATGEWLGLAVDAAGFTIAFGAHGIVVGLGGHSEDAVTSLLALYDGAEVILEPDVGSLADRIDARPVPPGGVRVRAGGLRLLFIPCPSASASGFLPGLRRHHRAGYGRHRRVRIRTGRLCRLRPAQGR
ncbi:hypothetical protein [Streptomyces litmocidini]|uniref:hypothetical protein n=1 Tax=Streptomyces litmocidini TaxID=67318 RepID=UPI0036F5EE07